MRREDAHSERNAAELGRLAHAIDGSLSAEADAAARARLLLALDAPRSSRRHWLLAAGGGAVLALAAAAFFLMRDSTQIEYRVWGASAGADGQWLGVAQDRDAGMLHFSEGTEIELLPGSQSRVAELTEHGAHVVLRTGKLRAHVMHRTRTRWLVGAGPYAIDVTGTAFDVEWRGGRLEVRLREGSVVVRGPSLHEGIRVSAGQRLVAHSETGNAELSTIEPPSKPAEPAPPPPIATSSPEHRGPVHPAPSWTDLLTDGNFKSVLALAHSRGIDTTLRRAPLADLVALSDAARYSGDRTLAQRGLLAQRDRFASSAEGRAAAFLLGRMADDTGATDEALRWYEVYLHESPRGAFAAEALGRKLVVVVRSGDTAAANALARHYLQRFAQGAHAAYAREVLQRP
ncbi:MAG TPA: FecR domain-containing protein [Polyangiales bacterium]|nr:FecR domain-containing protein [Polyangiales bacterium]